MYLKYLARSVKKLGGQMIKAVLPTEEGLAGALKAAFRVLEEHDNLSCIRSFVNATGLGARCLVPDAAVYPIRGQTVVVKGEAQNITTMFYDDANASVAPRLGSGTSILGSTYQEGNWDPEADESISEKILQRCKPWAAELLNDGRDFDVVGVNVGFRPGRKGGPRVELQQVDIQDPKYGIISLLVCHSYGHAGSGFQNSFGAARKAVNLIQSHLAQL